jgi:urocanate hydratase
MNYSNKALLTTLKRKTEQKEIFWDLQVKYTILGVKERETFAKFNQAVESGKIKTEINIS